MRVVFEEAVNLLEDGDPIVVATVVRTKGSTPQKPGSKLLVRKDGSGVGTLGGGCVEGDIWFAAKELLKRGGDTEYREYELNEDLAAEDGLVCGGTMFFQIDPGLFARTVPLLRPRDRRCLQGRRLRRACQHHPRRRRQRARRAQSCSYATPARPRGRSAPRGSTPTPQTEGSA